MCEESLQKGNSLQCVDGEADWCAMNSCCTLFALKTVDDGTRRTIKLFWNMCEESLQEADLLPCA